MNNDDPNTYDDAPEINPRIRNLRFALVGVIVVTVPFYLVGIVMLVLAGNNNSARGADPTEVIITPSPIGGELTATPTLRPTGTISSSPTARSNVGPTPFQFVPPTRTPTDEIIIPTDTPFPSLTPLPDATQAPPTNTPLPTVAPPTATFLPPEPTSPPPEPTDPPPEPTDPPAEPTSPPPEPTSPPPEPTSPPPEPTSPPPEPTSPPPEPTEPPAEPGNEPDEPTEPPAEPGNGESGEEEQQTTE